MRDANAEQTNCINGTLITRPFWCHWWAEEGSHDCYNANLKYQQRTGNDRALIVIKAILPADLPPHSQEGEVVSLPPGFAYNFLLKKHLATVVTPAILRQREQQHTAVARQQQLNTQKQRIEHTTLPFNLMVNHDGQAQGAITARQILQKLALTIGAVDRTN